MAYDPYRPNIPSQGILSVRDLYNFYSNNPTIRGEEETVTPTPTPTPISVDPIVPNRFSYFNDDDEDYLDFKPDITGGTFLSNYATNYLNNPANVLGSYAGYVLGPIGGYVATKAAMEAQRRNLLPETFTDVIDFNKQPDYDFGPDGDGVAFGENEVSVQDAINAGFGNVRGPDDDLTLDDKQADQQAAQQAAAQQSFMDQLENARTYAEDARLAIEQSDDGGGEGSGENEGGSGADSGSGTHDDPGD